LLEHIGEVEERIFRCGSIYWYICSLKERLVSMKEVKICSVIIKDIENWNNGTPVANFKPAKGEKL